MTEPIKETTFLIPGSACKDCSYISNIKERQVDNTSKHGGLLVLQEVKLFNMSSPLLLE